MLFAKNIALFIAFTLLLLFGQQEMLKAQQPNVSQNVSITSATQFFDICANPRLITFTLDLQDSISTTDSIFGYEAVIRYDTAQYTFVSVLPTNTLSQGMDVGSNFLDAGVLVLSGAFSNKEVLSTRQRRTLIAFTLRTKSRCEDTLAVNVVRHTWMYQRNGGLRISPRIVGSSSHQVVGRVVSLPERILSLQWKTDTLSFDSTTRSSAIEIYSPERTFQGLTEFDGKIHFPNFVQIDSIKTSADVASGFIVTSSDTTNSYRFVAYPEVFLENRPLATIYLSVDDDTTVRIGDILLEIDQFNSCACVSGIQSEAVTVIDSGKPRKDTSVSVEDEYNYSSRVIELQQRGQRISVKIENSIYEQLQYTIYDLKGREIYSTVFENRGAEVEIALPEWIQTGAYLFVVRVKNIEKSLLYRKY